MIDVLVDYTYCAEKVNDFGDNTIQKIYLCDDPGDIDAAG